MRTPSVLDCCGQAELGHVRAVYESVHDLEALLKCESCGTFWFYRFSERVNWDGGPDDQTSWYSPLTDDEAQSVLAQGNLVFLLSRPSWMDDNGDLRRVAGAPDRPRS